MIAAKPCLELIAASDSFWPLLEARLRGDMEPAAVRQLEQRLQTDETALRLYFELCRTEADLQFVLRSMRTDDRLATLIAAEPIDGSGRVECTTDEEVTLWQQVVDRMNEPLALALTIATLTISIVLLSLALWIVPAIAPPSPEDVPVARPTFVAQLAGAFDATWAEATATELKEGRDLYVGQALELTAGSAEIRYDSGVRVRLFGPAQWTISSATALQMQQGRAVALVTPPAVGFTVGTPVCDVIDLGTEFAVGCDPQGDVNVYVHEGEVEVAPAKTGQQHVRLTAGESLTVSRGGASELADTKEQEKLKRLALASGVTNNFATWQAQRDEWKADASLVAYYDFQRDAERPDELVNIAEATAGTLNGQLGVDDRNESRPTWSEGRYRGKGALRFDGSKQQFVRVTPAKPIDYREGITVAMWVRFGAEVADPAVLVAQREGGGRYAYQLAVMPPRSPGIQFLSGHEASKPGGYSGAAVLHGTHWEMLLVTSNEQETIFYRNGREIGRAAGTKIAPSETPISIGVNFERGATQPSHALHGFIDELAIFRRVITAEEVAQMFHKTRP